MAGETDACDVWVDSLLTRITESCAGDVLQLVHISRVRNVMVCNKYSIIIMMCVTRKQSLRPLPLSYPKKGWGPANPSSGMTYPKKGWGPANPSLGMTPTIKYYSTAFIDYIL